VNSALIRRILLALPLLLLFGASGSGPAYLVEDINRALVPSQASIQSIAVAADRLFLTIWHDGGPHLWTSDGTAGGARMVGSRVSGGSEPMTLASGEAIFVGSDLTHGSELWRSDGTEEGTTLVADIRPGPLGSQIQLFRKLGETLYFLADDGIHGRELWRTDGTTEGTSLAVNLNPGLGDSAISDFAAVGNRLFLIVYRYSEARPSELWVSDGTSDGTAFLRSFPDELYVVGRITYPIGAGSLADLGGIAYFFANDGTLGRELWRSDGTSEGTVLVHEIRPGSTGGCLTSHELVRFGGRLFFPADDGVNGREPWSTDGTRDGTTMVADVAAGAASSNPEWLTPTPRLLFFRASDGASGTELWKSDGTPSGTSLVADIESGPVGSNPVPLRAVGDLLYFSTYVETRGPGLWITDGSASGTRLVKAISTNAVVPFREFAYFPSTDSIGTKLWRTDGTPQNTVSVMEIGLRPGSSDPQPLADLSGEALFAATEPSGQQFLWRTDGSADGTARVSDRVTFSGGFIPDVSRIGNSIYFAGTDDRGTELWKTDGTDSGTVLVADIARSNVFASSFPSSPTLVGNQLFFSAADDGHGRELWKSNGTQSGTTLVKDIRPGWEDSTPFGLTDVRGTLLFLLLNGVTGGELWKSDGTEQGTVQIKDLRVESERVTVQSPTLFNDRLYFTAGPSRLGDWNLWASDGTADGTVVIKTFRSIPDEPPVSAGGRLFFIADDGEHWMELWATDGTPAGTVLVRDILPGPVGAVDVYRPYSKALTPVGPLVFFGASDETHGIELWRSDGTEAGTYMVRDVNPGSFSSNPAHFLDVGGGFVAFSADDGVNGAEPWVSNGTRLGTQMLQDIAPGPASSNPSSFLRSGGRVYFSANDGAHGNESWAVPFSAIESLVGKRVRATRLLPFRP
jgi:ELWxxDGT repeat protein